ncbi:hypothetical protein SNQ22_003475 [Cronobacter universalis]|nr:hypothetical protein [Cronobacter universalis]
MQSRDWTIKSLRCHSLADRRAGATPSFHDGGVTDKPSTVFTFLLVASAHAKKSPHYAGFKYGYSMISDEAYSHSITNNNKKSL